MGQTDLGYKDLFSNREMVKDLLTGFVKEEWIRELDFSSMDRVSGTYVSDDLRERQDDMVWKIGFRGRWLYVYILLEFQSTVDHWMGVRLLTYIGLLYQDLIKTGAIDKEGGLPPVLPLVIYSGKRRWNAPVSLDELLCKIPPGLDLYQPDLRYFKNFPAYDDLLEVDTMLAEKVKDWTRAWEKEGLRKGIRRGRREGIEEGRLEGIQKGIEKGLEQGLIQTVLRMLKKGMDIETVSDLLDLPLDKVKDISKNRDKYTYDIDV